MTRFDAPFVVRPVEPPIGVIILVDDAMLAIDQAVEAE
jgi:hypothetical protein